MFTLFGSPGLAIERSVDADLLYATDTSILPTSKVDLSKPKYNVKPQGSVALNTTPSYPATDPQLVYTDGIQWFEIPNKKTVQTMIDSVSPTTDFLFRNDTPVESMGGVVSTNPVLEIPISPNTTAQYDIRAVGRITGSGSPASVVYLATAVASRGADTTVSVTLLPDSGPSATYPNDGTMVSVVATGLTSPDPRVSFKAGVTSNTGTYAWVLTVLVSSITIS